MGWPKGKPRSEETKRKISTWELEHKPNLGNHLSDDAKHKISVAMSRTLQGNKRRLGIPHTEEVKQQISKTLKTKVTILRQQRLDWWADLNAEQRRIITKKSTDAMKKSWQLLSKEERIELTANSRLACKSEESLKKKSQSLSGNKNPMFGKHLTEERKKQSSMPGDKNPRWIGGLSRFPYPILFNGQLKESIRVQYNFHCQLCGISQVDLGRKLDIHHIDYNKDNLQDTNLIPLCRPCNTKVNINREHWKEYFAKLVK